MTATNFLVHAFLCACGSNKKPIPNTEQGFFYKNVKRNFSPDVELPLQQQQQLRVFIIFNMKCSRFSFRV